MKCQLKIDRFFSENYVKSLMALGEKKFYRAIDMITQRGKIVPLKELR